MIITDTGIHEECGVFGIYAPQEEVAKITYFGLFALQHRGQEGCGIAVYNEQEKIDYYKRLGLVSEVFDGKVLDTLKGTAAIGHVRYSTTGNNSELNTQPLVARYLQGEIAIGHNGNLTNAVALREDLARNGALFQTETDTELLCYLLARYGDHPLHVSFQHAMKHIEGSYAIVVLNRGKLYAARDPFGNRPLCIGELPGGYVVASESCALDTVGATFLRDVEPGEIIVIDEEGLHSYPTINPADQHPSHCVFEYVYFARPDSTIDGINVNQARRRMGEILAMETPKLDVDMVISVPDSGTTAAIGYAGANNQVFSQGILKNRYAGRTFIQPTQSMRERMVSLKLNPIRDEIEGRRIAVVDDSIVRGTTSKRLVSRLRERGAKEVHFLVSCPPVLYPCYYGIDTADRDKLIAAHKTLDEVCEYIGADSLQYLSMEGLYEAVGNGKRFCTACLDGNYRLGRP